MQAGHDWHNGVRFHFLDVASNYLQVLNQRRILECKAFHSVYSDIGQRRVPHFIDWERLSLDRTEFAVGDEQHIDGRDERVRWQFVHG